MSTGPNSASAESRRTPGQRVFGRFVLTRLIGRGGMGEVWLARDEKLDQDVALKFLTSAMLHNENAVERLKRETRHSLRLTHPNIVRIYDFVQDEQDAAISMEYIEGWSLWAMKVDRPHQCFTVEEIEPWIRQLCGALEYAHTAVDVVHRDLKPANLLIDSRLQLKVTDFGIARNLSGAVGQVTAALPPLGTLGYMSPQQTLGSEPSVLDDVYSLGATIYDLLTGQAPFYKGEVLAQVQQLTPPSMAERLHELGVAEPAIIPWSWEETVAACLQKDPARRPQSVSAVLQQLFSPQPAPTEIVPAAKLETASLAQSLANKKLRRILFALLALAFLCAVVLGLAIKFAKPLTERLTATQENSALPQGVSAGDAPILATRLFVGADDFVVDVFHNGHRVPDAARKMTREQYGAIGERTDVTVREGDWVVFNVANNRLRWNGAYYFGAAGVRDDGSIGLSSDENEQWSVCEDPGLAPRFIGEPQFFATNLARRIPRPWGGGDKMIKDHVKDWEGHAIWGEPTNRQIWIKFYAKPGDRK